MDRFKILLLLPLDFRRPLLCLEPLSSEKSERKKTEADEKFHLVALKYWSPRINVPVNQVPLRIAATCAIVCRAA